MTTVEFRSLADGEAWVRSQMDIWNKPCVVLLTGPMGAGKTQMVRWILAALGSGSAASPTFAIHHRYTVNNKSIDHFDLYRLENDQDLETTGFWDMLAEKDSLLLVEWADRLPLEAYRASRPIVRLDIQIQGSGRKLQFIQT